MQTRLQDSFTSLFFQTSLATPQPIRQAELAHTVQQNNNNNNNHNDTAALECSFLQFSHFPQHAFRECPLISLQPLLVIRPANGN